MGLAILVIYSAVFFMVAAVALVLSYFAFRGYPQADARMFAWRLGAYAAGIFIVPWLTLFVASEFPALGNHLLAVFLGAHGNRAAAESDLDKLLGGAVVMTLMPLSLGAALLVSAKLMQGSRAAIVGWLSAGALHSSLLTPFIGANVYEAHRASRSAAALASPLTPNRAAHPEPLKQRTVSFPSSRRPGGRER